MNSDGAPRPTLTPAERSARRARVELLRKAVGERILVLDGAMGTMIQSKGLRAADFGGAEHEGCNEHLVVTRPALIEGIHAEYFGAGADVTETNTFGGTPLVLGEYGLSSQAHRLNLQAARLARAAAERFSADGRPRWVAGSIGPTTKAISVTGGIGFEGLSAHFEAQAFGLLEGGVDFMLIETCQDTRNVKAAVLGMQRAFERAGDEVPIALSATIEPMGTMLAGQSVEALYASVEHLELLYLGLNCATGPEFMTDHLRSLARLSRFPLACVPNAGLPDENGRYLETPQMVARVLRRFAEAGWLNLVGGCCGTHSGHVRAMAEAVRGLAPRAAGAPRRSILSGIDFVDVEEARPVIVGERTNVIGSKKFKELICEGKWEEASEIARGQVKRGALVADICLANPDRDELEDMRRFLEAAVKKVRVPLMFDTTDERVAAAALTYSQGKAIINSINLEDGEGSFRRVAALSRKFGAALVVGCIDEEGMAVQRERKLKVAERCFGLLTEALGVPPEDIYFDPLVFPCASGDAKYAGSAVETIEGLRLIRQRFPRCRTVLGISNVSFGLPPAGREVLNSVFLYHCVQAGLDLALVNAEKLERYPQLPELERTLAEDLLFGRGADPAATFASHFRERKPKVADRSSLPLDERLARHVVEGSREGLFEDLEEKLRTTAPLEIINGPLMKGMDEVGRLFASNELIVAEVLQSAEAMKAAVSYLQPKMGQGAGPQRGKVLLATVKGDVHDIGKNLVEIILANNGFQVVNLGIKVSPEKLVQAVREHRPDLLGLSGLLVKSAQQMVSTAEDLSRAGVEVPVLVGGAALSGSFVDRQIAPAYAGTVAHARDAMAGLELAKRMVEPASRARLERELAERRSKLKQEERVRPRPPSASTARSPHIPILGRLPEPPDLERHVLTLAPLEHIWRFVNPVMLYGRHFGVKGSAARALGTKEEGRLRGTEEGEKALELKRAIDALKAHLKESERMKAKAVFRFFKAASEGNFIHLFEEGRTSPAASFEFPRQEGEPRACLSDFVSPLEAPPKDSLCLFVTTAGEGVRELSEELKSRGEFLKMHAVQALALETAEAYAEMLHAQIRSMWGFPDPPELTMLERFRAEYQGKRYSFGYPACPHLEDQAKLFSLLSPEEIGVSLTDGCMMEPEASVSAMVFHHPGAFYFSVA
ncbi:MAG: methionine synthase [Myxococcales bacterium]|nr:methionine synthase [Myxococcales bacterium]